MARLGSHSDVAHNWAHNAAIDTRNSRNSEIYESSSMSRDCSGNLYSYATVIARRVADRQFLITTETYSMTTSSKHMPEAKRAAFGTVAYVPNVRHNDKNCIRFNVEYLIEQLRDSAYAACRGTTYHGFDHALSNLLAYLEIEPSAKRYLPRKIGDRKASGSIVEFYESIESDWFKDEQKALDAKKRQEASDKTRETREGNYHRNLDVFRWLTSGSQENMPSCLNESSWSRENHSQEMLFATGRIHSYAAAKRIKFVDGKQSGYVVLSKLFKECREAVKMASNIDLQAYRDKRQAIFDMLAQRQSTTDWRVNNHSLISNIDGKPFTYRQLFTAQEYSEFSWRLAQMPKCLPCDDGTYSGGQKTVRDIELARAVNQLLLFVRLPYVSIVEAKRKAERAERERLAKLSNRERILDWYKGGQHHFGYGSSEYRLRIVGDSIQTSGNASVPTKLAAMVWPRLLEYFDGKRDADRLPTQFGSYRLYAKDQSNRSEIRIGCHRIHKREFVRIAQRLNLVPVNPWTTAATFDPDLCN